MGKDESRGSRTLIPQELLEILSTRWIADDEDREVVTLTINDKEVGARDSTTPCESRWIHIKSDKMTFQEFKREVSHVPGLGNEDMAVVGRLLNKVQRICENKFVHGRYLKPISRAYDGEDADGESEYNRTATFISLPVFTIEPPRRHVSGKDFEGHPVRGLLQTRYRLESTFRRDKEQVITKGGHDDYKGAIIQVPQVWALLINRHTLVTCANLDMTSLRGNTIKLMSYSQAQSDKATWSMHFTDTSGRTSYLSLRYSRTWLGLIKHICDDTLTSDRSLIRDDLLRNGFRFKLITSHNEGVTADSWPRLIEEKRSEMIRLRLIERVIVTELNADCNEVGSRLAWPVSSWTFNDSDHVSDIISGDIHKLQSLRAELEDAFDRGDSTKAELLRGKIIPTLEERIIDLIVESMRLSATNRLGRLWRPSFSSDNDREEGSDHDKEEGTDNQEDKTALSRKTQDYVIEETRQLSLSTQSESEVLDRPAVPQAKADLVAPSARWDTA